MLQSHTTAFIIIFINDENEAFLSVEKSLKKILKLNSTMNLSVYWILVVYLYFLDIHTIQTLVIKKVKE